MAFADFQALYKQKLTTADEAVKVIKSGDWVDYGFCAIHPRVLDEALARRAPELEDVKVRGGISLWKPAIFDIEDPVHHIIFNSHHMSSVERHHIASGAGFHEPMRYSELPRYYYDHITPPDVAMFQVAPMDKHGYFNFGLSASHVKAVCEMAKVVIVEVNENMPRCLGGFDNCIHVSEVDMIVEGRNDPMGIQPSGTATEVDRAVAKLIVEQIPDGACLQLGIGGMPNTVGAMLCESDLKDLGVHTEMYVDAYVDLAMAGKVDVHEEEHRPGPAGVRLCRRYPEAVRLSGRQPGVHGRAHQLHQRHPHHRGHRQLCLHQQRGGCGPVRAGER